MDKDLVPIESGINSGIFELADVATLANLLEVETTARRLAAQKIPLPEFPLRTGKEDEIVETLQYMFSEAERQAREEIIKTVSAYEIANVKTLEDDAQNIVTGFESKLKELQLHHTRILDDAYQRVVAAEVGVEDFKEENKLYREGRRRGKPRRHYSLMAIMIVVEGAINSINYADASDQGLAGGFFMAGIVSFVNVLGGGAIGQFCLRAFYQHNFAKKVLFGVLMAVIVIVLGSINLMAGHFRTILEINNSTGDFVGSLTLMLDTATRFWNDWTNIGSFNGIILSVVGSGFALVAAGKQFFFEDPFPGYSAVLANLDKQRDKFVDLQKAFFDKVGEASTEFGKRLANLTVSGEKIVRDMAMQLAKVDSYVFAVDTFLRKCEATTEALIERYRRNYRNVANDTKASLEKVGDVDLNTRFDLAAEIPSKDHLQEQKEYFKKVQKEHFAPCAKSLEMLRQDYTQRVTGRYSEQKSVVAP